MALDPAAFGYSGLTRLSSNRTHVTLGCVWEGAGGLRFIAVTGLLPLGEGAAPPPRSLKLDDGSAKV
jgi:hypothetical protein